MIFNNDKKWFIDVFQLENEGLIIAEN